MMDYHEIFDLLLTWPDYRIVVSVGRMHIPVDRAEFVEELSDKGENFNFQFAMEVDHDCNDLIITDEV